MRLQLLRMRRITWAMRRGKFSPHIWNPWLRFVYSLYNFYGDTMTFKGRKLLSPVYTIQPVVKPVIKPVWQPGKCLYTRYNRCQTRCQTGCQTGLTTGCIVYTAGCQTGCTTRFDNRLNEQPLFVQPVKVIWRKAALPQLTDSSIVFARWRQRAFPLGHVGAPGEHDLKCASFGHIMLDGLEQIY